MKCLCGLTGGATQIKEHIAISRPQPPRRDEFNTVASFIEAFGQFNDSLSSWRVQHGVARTRDAVYHSIHNRQLIPLE